MNINCEKQNRLKFVYKLTGKYEKIGLKMIVKETTESSNKFVEQREKDFADSNRVLNIWK